MDGVPPITGTQPHTPDATFAPVATWSPTMHVRLFSSPPQSIPVLPGAAPHPHAEFTGTQEPPQHASPPSQSMKDAHSTHVAAVPSPTHTGVESLHAFSCSPHT
jgi:hypothetical protein